jgi:hypothetical protein
MKAGNGERGTGNVPMARVSVVCFVLSEMDSTTAIHMLPVPCSPFPIS